MKIGVASGSEAQSYNNDFRFCRRQTNAKHCETSTLVRAEAVNSTKAVRNKNKLIEKDNYHQGDFITMIRTDLYFNKLRELRAKLDEAGYSL